VSLVIVTATTNPAQAHECLESWVMTAEDPPLIIAVVNGCERPDDFTIKGTNVAWIYREEYLGSVPAFRLGVEAALSMPTKFEVIACFHDDFEIHQQRWDAKVLRMFERHPATGLAGFGGAIGLGALDLYQKPYDPMSLARVGFRSDLDEAEVHGIRSVLVEQVACLDGFSQIGRRQFWEGQRFESSDPPRGLTTLFRPWTVLEDLGFIHHFYDGALGCLAARYGWETWYLPLRARHWGGRTAVGDPGYQHWAKQVNPQGDHGFWEFAHQIGYEEFRDVLPLRV